MTHRSDFLTVRTVSPARQPALHRSDRSSNRIFEPQPIAFLPRWGLFRPSLALVLFDLDSFKHYNDTLGHVVGDQILRAFGEVLMEENRAMNLVARYGGDEFVAVLSEGDELGAHGYLARLYAGIKTACWQSH